MPREVSNKLTATTVRRLKEPGRYADGSGLYLVVSETGARWWQWRGTVHGRRRELGMGSAQLVSLAEAREQALQWRRIARDGGDPAQERDKSKKTSLTFEQAARRVHAEQIVPNNRNPKHVAQWLKTLADYAFPVIGKHPVHAIGQADILRVLAPIWTEKPETARRVRQRLRTVLDWAQASGRRDGVNPVNGVEKGLPKQRDRTQHFKALPWQDLPGFAKRLEEVDGMGALALRFAILTAARSGEVRGARWEEFDLDSRIWTIPASRMKADVEHRVPLSDAALEIVRAVEGLSSAYVFPSPKAGKPLSDMTLTAVLRRLGVAATTHGFRSTFRDWAEEATSYPHEVKEAALAHTVRNKVERAYRRTDLFERRRRMMDDWAIFATGKKRKAVSDEH